MQGLKSTKEELQAERQTMRNLINRALKPNSRIKEIELRALFEMLRKIERKIEQSGK